MSYRAKNGKIYPYKETPWQYKERNSGSGNEEDGCISLVVIGFLISIIYPIKIAIEKVSIFISENWRIIILSILSLILISLLSYIIYTISKNK